MRTYYGSRTLILLFSLSLGGCADAPSVLNPRGPASESIADLWWLLFALGTAVYVAVMGFMLFVLFCRQRGEMEERTENRRGTRIILMAGIVLPAIILLIVYGFSFGTLRALSSPAIPEELTIHVVGHQWWWEVRYPHQQFVTANEIHIPVGQPVQVILSSDDVIHSFWVPELQGKLDLIPGQTNRFWLQADEPGVYRGECAEFCGVQHTKMAFLVVAEPAAQYEAWLAQQQQPAAEPTEPKAQRGLQVFLNTTCIQCHTIRGTHATGDLGPDLTHVASRRTLGAGAVANNRGNLGGWIADPQSIKPGNFMPPSTLTAPELQALLAYLATLN